MAFDPSGCPAPAFTPQMCGVSVTDEVDEARELRSDGGLPVDPARVDQPIQAEFLLSPTGLILAVRFAE